MSYTKLFSSIVTSTIWTEDASVCKVWVTMLAIANKHGEVHASIPGLAQIAGLQRDVVESAIEKFLSPDRYSRTPDDEGRRIEPIDGGWILLNHAKYRAMASKDEEKTAAAKRQAAFRDRQKRNGKVTESNDLSRKGNATVTPNRDIAEADTDTDTDTDPLKDKKETQEKSSAPSAWSPSPEQIEVGSWFGRKPTTAWTEKELKAWKGIDDETLADGIAILAAPYRAKEKFTRRDLATLLNNWLGEIDRWRSYKPPVQSDVTPAQPDYRDPAFLTDPAAIFHKNKEPNLP